MSAIALVPVGDRNWSAVDAQDLPLVLSRSWYPHPTNGGRIYAAAHKESGGTLYLHRLLSGCPQGFEVDHANGDGLDNRRSNLRIATRSQNEANKRKSRRSGSARPTSQFKGVSWETRRQRWVAQLAVDGKHRFLGYFTDELHAARAYDQAAYKAWGEFAHLNMPLAQAGQLAIEGTVTR
jgi:hypothetical protein